MISNKEVYPEGVLSPERIQSFITATQTLRAQAAGHAELGRFKLAERDEDYFQDFRAVYFEPVTDPSLEKIDSMSTMLMGKAEDQPDAPDYFQQLRDAFHKKPHVLEEARETMADGKRIMIITNHGELADVAMVMTAFQCEIADLKLIRGTRLFVGPIVKELEVMGYPVIAALQESSGVFVAFPDTDNTDKKIQEKLLDPILKSETNNAMLNEFIAQMARGEIILSVVAASGSTDKTESGLTIMKKVSSGTAVIARRYHDFILPVAISMSGHKIGFEVGDLQSLHKGKSIHDVMEDDLAPMYGRVSGKKVIYERPVPKKFLPKNKELELHT
ncbi:MAG: hypothetical protein Q7R60_03875 [bacterium]|nr:hypothetical protein [bacterium]